MCARFRRKILNFILVGACQNSQFFSNKQLGILEIVQICLNLGIKFYMTWSELLKYKKIHYIKANFKLTMQVVVLA